MGVCVSKSKYIRTQSLSTKSNLTNMISVSTRKNDNLIFIKVNYDGMITEVSDNFLKMFEWDRSDIIWKSVTVLMNNKNIVEAHMKTFMELKNGTYNYDEKSVVIHKLIVTVKGKNTTNKAHIVVYNNYTYMTVVFKMFDNTVIKDFNNIDIVPRITHDVRNHLHSSDSGLSLLLDYENNNSGSKEEKNNIIKSILASNIQISELISTNIELYQMTLGFIKNKWVNLDKLISDITNLVTTVYTSNNIKLCVKQNVKKVEIYTVEFALKSILSNLVTNAFKYTTTGFININCILKPNIHGSMCTCKFIIENTSSEFPQSVKDYLLDNSSYDQVTNVIGTGIGIKIIKNMLKVIGGDITIDSNNDIVTIEITVTSRYKISHKSPNILNRVIEKRNMNINETVLIVDDNKISVSVLNKILGGNKVYVAYNGLEGLNIFRTHRDINIIFMDIHMPVMDGIEATKEIRKLCPHIVIVCISANDDLSVSDRKLFDLMLCKPFSKNNVINIMKTISSMSSMSSMSKN